MNLITELDIARGKFSISLSTILQRDPRFRDCSSEKSLKSMLAVVILAFCVINVLYQEMSQFHLEITWRSKRNQ